MAPLKIGVMFEEVQSSDVIMPADLLGSCSVEYAEATKELQVEDLTSYASDLEFYWIASEENKPTRMIPGMNMVATASYETAPRDLYILLIGGPLPTHRPAAADKFMKEAWPSTKHVLTTCIGSLWLASTGLLDGKKATTNREALELAKTWHPKVEWLDQRWVISEDDKLWTSGGAYAGGDMTATFLKKHVHEKIAKAVLAGLDVDETARGQFYKS